jgi:hypothetical protein
MLMVADGLIALMAAHRERSGIDLHARIGIALGSTASGVLGRLQPRFVVFGEAMSAAAELEQTGIKDAAHCSADFLRCIRRAPGAYIDHEDASQHSPSGMQEKRSLLSRMLTQRSIRLLNHAQADEARTKAATCLDANRQGGPGSTQLDAACAREQVVERMLAGGKLFVQQNMMAAQPHALAMATLVQCRDSHMPECEQFGLRTVLSREGNFVVNWFGDVSHALRRSVDSNGMLTPLRHNCPGSSTTKIESVPEEVTALGVGWGEGARGEITGATTRQEE